LPKFSNRLPPTVPREFRNEEKKLSVIENFSFIDISQSIVLQTVYRFNNVIVVSGMSKSKAQPPPHVIPEQTTMR